MTKYLNEISKAHIAVAEPMIKQQRVKPSRLKLKARLIKYYRRAKGVKAERTLKQSRLTLILIS